MPPPYTDETKARPELVGSLTHQVIAHLAARTLSPDVETIRRSVREAFPHLGENEGRAHKQNIAGRVRTYFTQLLPPTDFSYVGSELHLGQGRVDLLWRNGSGTLLIDEVKTGLGFLLDCTPNRQQAQRYLADGLAAHGPALAGVRLLSTDMPAKSLFFAPGKQPGRLFTTN
ncbi:MAG: PD-(D/E)XK nuclease family protein, partial [Mycobacteriaceae bacterium]